MRRAAFFAVCTSKEHLSDWIREFLDIRLPDAIVCDDDNGTNAASNSSVMDLIWETYSAALRGDPDFQRVLAYAARDAGKTLACSVLEILCLFHLSRDVAHLAATMAQSTVCAQYISNYFKRPILRDYVTTDNSREIGVTWYESRDGTKRLDWRTFAKLNKASPESVAQFVERSQKMKIMVATLNGVNAVHAAFVAIDECDLIPAAVYKEANVGVASETRDKKPAITFIISTRKFAFGQVQKEIDNAATTGLKVRHWNLVDVTAPCPASRHRPDLPKTKLFINDEALEALSVEDHAALSEAEQAKYISKEAYEGCRTNCRLFAVCRGRLAHKQTSRSPMLKSLEHVTGKFRSSDPEKAKSQLMCYKPGNVGLIYPNLRADRHLVTAVKMYNIMTGDNRERMEMHEFIKFLRDQECKFDAGMDFGFTHNFAVALGARWRNISIIFRSFQVTEFELSQKIELCDKLLKPFDPTIWADPAYPSDIKSFKRSGYRMANFKKEVIEGINSVRAKVQPSLGAPPEVYWISDDPGTLAGFMQMMKYHWMVDSSTELPTDQPDEEDDDYPDAVRYLLGNLYGKKIHKRTDPPPYLPEQEPQSIAAAAQAENEQVWRQQIQNLTGNEYVPEGAAPIEYRGRRRKFFG